MKAPCKPEALKPKLNPKAQALNLKAQARDLNPRNKPEFHRNATRLVGRCTEQQQGSNAHRMYGGVPWRVGFRV